MFRGGQMNNSQPEKEDPFAVILSGICLYARTFPDHSYFLILYPSILAKRPWTDKWAQGTIESPKPL
jgi:hypothetical protein